MLFLGFSFIEKVVSQLIFNLLENLLMKSGMKTPHRIKAKSVKIPMQTQYVQSAPHVFFIGFPEA